MQRPSPFTREVNCQCTMNLERDEFAESTCQPGQTQQINSLSGNVVVPPNRRSRLGEGRMPGAGGTVLTEV